MDSFNIMGIGACVAVVLMALCWTIRLIIADICNNHKKEKSKK